MWIDYLIKFSLGRKNDLVKLEGAIKDFIIAVTVQREAMIMDQVKGILKEKSER